MAAEAAASERTKQVLQGFEPEKINRLVGNFEARFGVLRLAEVATGCTLRRRRNLRRLLRVDVAFLCEALHEFIEEIADLVIIQWSRIPQHFTEFFTDQVFGDEVAFLNRAENGFTKRFHRMGGVEFRQAVILGFKTTLEQEVAQALKQLVE